VDGLSQHDESEIKPKITSQKTLFLLHLREHHIQKPFKQFQAR
jgi:hypothetical protein